MAPLFYLKLLEEVVPFVVYLSELFNFAELEGLRCFCVILYSSVPPGGPFRGRCFVTRQSTQNEGAKPLLRYVIWSNTDCVGLKHFTLIMRHGLKMVLRKVCLKYLTCIALGTKV